MVQKIGVGEIVAAFGVAIFARQVPQFVGSIIGPIDAVSRSVGQREFVAALEISVVASLFPSCDGSFGEWFCKIGSEVVASFIEAVPIGHGTEIFSEETDDGDNKKKSRFFQWQNLFFRSYYAIFLL